MMHSRLAAIAILALCGTGAQSQVGQHRPVDDAEVYAATLDSVFAHSSGHRIVVESRTEKGVSRSNRVASYWEQLEKIPGMDPSTFDSFEKENRERATLPRIDAKRIAVELADDTVFDNLKKIEIREDTTRLTNAGRYWKRFTARFGDALGVASFTRIGYNKARNEALLEMGFGCGSLCGEGRIVMLRKNQGVWRVVYMKLTWVS
jgi:hypothetical protein